MIFEKSYRNWTEFEREVLRKNDRPDVRVDELLDEFDNDTKRSKRRPKRQGLFDLPDDEESEGYMYNE